MPKPMRSRPRAPIEAYGRTAAGAKGSMPRCRRMALTAAARSGAVSASVPSKSNSAARAGRLLVTHAAQEIVDVAIALEPVAAAERVVGHADELGAAQARVARPARKLRGLDEAQVVVRAARQQAQEVFGADYREKIALRIAVDGREEHVPARPHQARAGGDHGCRLGNVLEELHAGHDIESAGMAPGIVLRSRVLVAHQGLALHEVQLGDPQRFLGEIDAGDAGAAPSHRLGEDAAAAADIEHAFAGERDALVDPVEPQRIDFVQRTELALRIPPSRSELAELLELCRIGVHEPLSQKKAPPKRGLV